MSNPGAASTVSIHPSNLATNQALRLIAVVQGLNLAAAGDTTASVLNTSVFVPVRVLIANANNDGANVDVSAVEVGVYPAASKGGTSILTAAALTSQTTAAYVTSSAATNANTAQTAQILYFNVGGTVATATADVYVYGYDLTGPQTN
jgi:hypothetical protein